MMTAPQRPTPMSTERIDPAAPPTRHGWSVQSMLRENRIQIETPANDASDRKPSGDLFPALRAAAMFARPEDECEPDTQLTMAAATD